MSGKVPVGDFKWLSRQEINNLNIRHLDPDGSVGYFFEVDLEIPPHLHDLMADFPPVHERAAVKDDWLSEYQRRLQMLYNIKSNENNKKLLATLLPKKNYVAHYKNLQLYLKLGCKLTRVWSAVSFSQEAIMRNYVTYNSEQRKLARTASEKNHWKFLTNSLYGNKYY